MQSVDRKVQAKADQVDASLHVFDNMRQRNFLTDFTIICNEVEFRTHRVVLSAGSPYFRAMFGTEMKEALTGQVRLEVTDAVTMQTVVDFIYTGQVGADVEGSVDRLRMVLQAAHFLQITALFKFCFDTLRDRLSADYFLDLWNLAELYGYLGVLEDVPNFVVANLYRAGSSSDFMGLNGLQVQLLLNHPNLSPSLANSGMTMDDMVKFIVDWAVVDEETRRDDLTILLDCLDLNSMTSPYTQYLLSYSPIVERSPDVANMLLSMLMTQQTMSTVTVRPEVSSHLASFCKRNGKDVLTVFNLDGRYWNPETAIPFQLSDDMAHVAYQRDVIFFHGVQVTRYCPNDNSVTPIGALVLPCWSAGAGVLNDSIYVIGGVDAKGKAVHTAQRYDLQTGACEVLPTTVQGHVAPTVGTANGKIYLVGSVVECYDCDHWNVVGTIPLPIRIRCAATISRTRIDVVVDSEKLCSYDIDLNEWHKAHDATCNTSGIWHIWDFGNGESVEVDSVFSSAAEPVQLIVRCRDNRIFSLDPVTVSWEQLSAEKTTSWDVCKSVVF